MSQQYVWLTRAEPAVEAQRQLFDDLAVASIVEPLMRITPLSDIEREHYRVAMAGFADIDLCVFISANAVEQLLPLLSKNELAMLRQKQVFAVGKATQQALANAGVLSLAPLVNTSSEALLAMTELQSVAGQRIVIFRGVGGRGYLQQQLTGRGAVVDHIEIYRRSSPDSLSSSLLSYYYANQIAVVLVGSVETFDNLLQLLPEWSKTIDMVVPSQRVAEHIQGNGYDCVHVSTTAHNTDMVAKACALL